jgi:ribosome assembly protein 4
MPEKYPERLVSGSDDTTLFLWTLPNHSNPRARMVGHLLPINEVSFSANGSWIASASFDRSIKLWDGLTGGFVLSFIGHKAAVYKCSWSPDSSSIASASRDGLLKLWKIHSSKPVKTLSGHLGNVFALDWSPDGSFLASGGEDGLLRIWMCFF